MQNDKAIQDLQYASQSLNWDYINKLKENPDAFRKFVDKGRALNQLFEKLREMA